jgi:hypothetical protein
VQALDVPLQLQHHCTVVTNVGNGPSASMFNPRMACAGQDCSTNVATFNQNACRPYSTATCPQTASSNPDRDAERSILRYFKAAIVQDPTDITGAWTLPSSVSAVLPCHPPQWGGILCGGYGEVVKIQLGSRGLVGSLAEDMLKLPDIQVCPPSHPCLRSCVDSG